MPLRWLLIRGSAKPEEPQAFLSADPALAPTQLLTWYSRRWYMEVTFQAVRTSLGAETPPRGCPKWLDQVILRTTPALLGLCSWLALATHVLQWGQAVTPHGSAWYSKQKPHFLRCAGLLAPDAVARPPFFACPRSRPTAKN